MKILLILPPLTQLNTPYPSTPFLYSWLKKAGYEVYQRDIGIELIIKIFSKIGLNLIFDEVQKSQKELNAASKKIIQLREEYCAIAENVIRFLQGKDSTLAYTIVTGNYLPQGNRFKQLDELDECFFGLMGVQDKAKFLATLFIEDIGDFITENISSHFGFSRYAEKIGISANSFATIQTEVYKNNTIIDNFYIEILENHIKKLQPDITGFSVPFHGTLFGTLKCAHHIKQNFNNIKIILGGGYINTELREISDSDFFNFVDFVTLDDGEMPFIALLEHIQGERNSENLMRCFLKSNGKIEFFNNSNLEDAKHSDTGIPDYEGLTMSDYISVLEIANPMQRLWTDGRWNKLTIAHGCYWHKCSFCDTSLDYIHRYQASDAKNIVNKIEKVIAQTQSSGFHFVDEAAPPKLLKEIALELIRRRVKITWWANIRFEENFTEDVCKLLAESGCIAVSGGLEVASDRILKLINKGVSIKQAACVTNNFSRAGIMVHSYLMYGFPTQTEQEIIDSLEIIRQFFEHELIQSGFWHLFTLTAHSEIAKNPENFEIQICGPEKQGFAWNDLQHKDLISIDYHKFGSGLKKAIYNYMHGIGYDFPISFWFEFESPKTSVKNNTILKYITQNKTNYQNNSYLTTIWIAGLIDSLEYVSEKKGKQKRYIKLSWQTKSDSINLHIPEQLGLWLKNKINSCSLHFSNKIEIAEWITEYEQKFNEKFSTFENSTTWKTLRKNGLLII